MFLAAMIPVVQVDLAGQDYLGDPHNQFLGLQKAQGDLEVL